MVLQNQFILSQGTPTKPIETSSLESTRPYLEPYTLGVAILTALAVVGTAIWSFYFQRGQLKLQEQLFEAQKNQLKLQEQLFELQKDQLDTQKNENARQEKRQRLELMSKLTENYLYLAYELKLKVNRGEYPVDDYYRRYWSQLNSDYEGWLYELIPNQVYAKWLHAERKKYKDKTQIGSDTEKDKKKNYEEGYALVMRERIKDASLFYDDLMHKIFSDSLDDNHPIKAIVDILNEFRSTNKNKLGV